jgi:hypothetical protein
MAVSGISPASATPQSTQADPRQLFLQLTNAINSGNVSGAQQALTQLNQALGSSTANDPNNPFAQALNTIGQALQNNDINGAQQALAQLQQARAGGGHHHHGGHHGESQPNSSGTPTATVPTGTGGANVDVTI